MATSLKDLSENNSDDLDENLQEPEAFAVKYLGSTIIESARSEEATAEAVKSIISTAKGIEIIFNINKIEFIKNDGNI